MLLYHIAAMIGDRWHSLMADGTTMRLCRSTCLLWKLSQGLYSGIFGGKENPGEGFSPSQIISSKARACQDTMSPTAKRRQGPRSISVPFFPAQITVVRPVQEKIPSCTHPKGLGFSGKRMERRPTSTPIDHQHR